MLFDLFKFTIHAIPQSFKSMRKLSFVIVAAYLMITDIRELENYN